MTKLVYVMRGVPGSGKSTWIKGNLYGIEAVVVSADHYFLDSEGKYNFDPSKLGEAHAACLCAFTRAVQSGERYVVVDNTNTTNVEAAPYVALAQAYGYTVKFVVTSTTPVDVAAARNVHGVPEGAVARMAATLEGELKSIPFHWKGLEVVNG